MKIESTLRKKLVDEINFVIRKMLEEKDDPRKQMYFFSGIYAALHRIFNFQFDSELVFAHLVLNTTYSNIEARLSSIQSGQERVVKLPDGFFEKLMDITQELLRKIEKNESLYEVLQKFAIMSYVTTGNGYYLYKKGLLQIHEEGPQKPRKKKLPIRKLTL